MLVRDALVEAIGAKERAGYASARFVVPLGPLTLSFPNPGHLREHDIHHVALGVPTTFWGEVEISAYELRSGVPTLLIAFLAVGAVALGFVLAPVRVVRWLRAYRGTANAYGADVDALGALSVDELRARLRLPRV